MDAAAALRCNVILQTSVKSFALLDREELRWFVTRYMKKHDIQVYLHLDHAQKTEIIAEAIANGWDSVMVDASDRPLEENIGLTNEVCAMAEKSGVLVEAEIGAVGKTRDEIDVKEAGIATIEDIKRFVKSTRIDLLAAAIGTSHGSYHESPQIHYDLIEETGRITDVPLVVHGGTGLGDETLLRLLSYPNIKKINISTDVKLAYRNGILECIQGGYMEEEDFNPLKVTKLIHDSIENMVAKKLRLLRI